MENFINPPPDTRILKIVHGLPGSSEQQEALFQNLLSQGFGGIVCNVSFQDYLESEENWQAFVRGVRRAKELGMALWLYDERGYPSGTAGGLTLKDNPEWEARGLLCLDEDVKEGEEINLEVPPGKLIGAFAFPLDSQGGIELEKKKDLTTEVRDSKLVWKAEKGDWKILIISENRLYENTHSAISFGDRLPYINLLMPEPTRKFIELTHERYAEYLGKNLGEYFIATFTDEPSLMSYFFIPTHYRPIPWAPNLPGEFHKRCGYELLPYVPLLFTDGKGCEKVRHDFWKTVGELVAENFFGQIRDWCRAHNIASGGHLLLEESLSAHIALYGNFFLCAKYLDAPSIDCLTSIPKEVPWQIARLIGSVRDLNKSIYTMCETSDFIQVYRPQGDTRPIRIVTEEEIRGTCNRLIHGGINTITSYYTFQKLTEEQLRRLNLWVGRCCYMMRGGHQVADIAVLYPAESLWTHFRPARYGATDSPLVHRIESIFNQVSNSLYEANRDFLYIDTPTLLESSLQGDSFVYNALRWRILILPGVDTLPLEAWEKIERFWENGGIVISLGLLPQNSDRDFPSPDVIKLRHKLFGKEEKMSIKSNEKNGVAVFLPFGAISLLPALLDRLLERDVELKEPNTSLRVTHRQIKGYEVYFIINDSDKACRQALSFRGKGGEIWNPADGSVAPLPEEKWIELEFEPYGAIIVLFNEVKIPQKLIFQEISQSFKSSSPIFSPPTLGCGEFVEGKLKETKLGEEIAWQIKGKLTKSDVDCYLFVSFLPLSPMDLREAKFLRFPIVVPKKQKSSTNILVVVSDKNGTEYIADTGVILTDYGTREVFVPLYSFQPVPWKETRAIDWEHITAISIGWGGYYGKEGEEICFTTSSPQLVYVQ